MANFIKNKNLVVLDDDNNFVDFLTIDKQFFLTNDPIEGLFSFDDYLLAVKNPMSMRVVRLYLLNDDESIKADVSQYLVSCSIDLTYQQGITHSASITLLNIDKVWNPNPVKGFLWKGTKFRIDIGLYNNKKIFWGKYGTYVSENISIDWVGKTVSVQLYDKFALFDGTIGGDTDREHKIPVGTSIKTAIEQCLIAEKDDGGYYDRKSIIFPISKTDIVTPYTITKSSGTTYGEIMIELADMISCDIYYNQDGFLTLSENSDSTPIENKTVLWHFDDLTPLFSNGNTNLDFANVINKVSVFGAILNGKICKGIAINENAKSQTNIHMSGIKSEYIEDQNIYSDELCLERANYELQKKSLLALQEQFNCVFIPSLSVNNLVLWTNLQRGYLDSKFFINSIHIEALGNELIDISLTNIENVALK